MHRNATNVILLAVVVTQLAFHELSGIGLSGVCALCHFTLNIPLK